MNFELKLEFGVIKFRVIKLKVIEFEVILTLMNLILDGGFGASKDILSVLPSGLENCPLSTDKKGILVNVDFYRRKMQHKSISRRF